MRSRDRNAAQKEFNSLLTTPAPWRLDGKLQSSMTADPVKTTYIKISNRTAGNLRCILVASIVFLLRPAPPLQAVTVEVDGTQPYFGDYARTVCQTPNCVAVGAALDSAFFDPRASELIDYLIFEDPQTRLCRDFDLIAPEELTSMFDAGISMTNVQTANLQRRMDKVRAGSSGFSASISGRDFNSGLAGPTGPDGKSGPTVNPARPDLRWGFFVAGFGEFTNVDGTTNAAGYDTNAGGVTFGIDYRLTPNFAIGLTGGYASSHSELTDDGHMDMDGGKIGLYATAFSGGFYVNGAATFGFNDYDTDRTGLGGPAIGSTEGSDVTGLIAMGYDWKKGGLTIGPTASFQYTYVEFDGFTEQGSLAPLILGDQDVDSSRTALGVKASYDFQAGHAVVRPELRAAWQHEFGDLEYPITSSFANGAGNAFTVTGPEVGADSALVGAGVAVIFNDRISIYAYYDGEFGRTNYVSHNVSGGVRVNF